MAKHKTRTQSAALNANSTLFFMLLLGLVAGFVLGFFFAKDRYMQKIREISKMNMEKAVTVDNLEEKLRVLGASTDVQ